MTVPLLVALKKTFPRASVTFLVSNTTAPLFQGQPFFDELWTYDPTGRHQGRRGFKQLVRTLGGAAFDAALMVYPERRLSWAMVRAGVPMRVGTGRRWWSWMYTRRVRHSRKAVEKHEADYNLDLLRALGSAATLEYPRLEVSDAHLAEVKTRLQALGHNRSKPLILVHPGGRGSSANWQPQCYAALLTCLAEDLTCTLVLTGTGKELDLARKIETMAKALAPRPWKGQLKVMDPAVALNQLPALMATGAMVICGNTGPMHIAAAVGTPVTAVFPPSGVTGPKRWGPLAKEGMIFTASGDPHERFRHGITSQQLDPRLVADKVLAWFKKHQGVSS